MRLVSTRRLPAGAFAYTWAGALAAALLALACPAPAPAALWTVQVSDATAAAGSSGSVNVTLRYSISAPGPGELAAFAFLVHLESVPGVRFVPGSPDPVGFGANYVFDGASAGQSVGIPYGAVSDASVLAADIAFPGPSVPIQPGATFDLGEIFFEIDPGTAPTTAATNFDPVITGLEDAGGAVPITDIELVGGRITVEGAAAVPEPAGAVLLGLGALTLGWVRRRGRAA